MARPPRRRTSPRRLLGPQLRRLEEVDLAAEPALGLGHLGADVELLELLLGEAQQLAEQALAAAAAMVSHRLRLERLRLEPGEAGVLERRDAALLEQAADVAAAARLRSRSPTTLSGAFGSASTMSPPAAATPSGRVSTPTSTADGVCSLCRR